MIYAPKWWEADFPSRYYAFSTDRTTGGYPSAGLADLDIYSSRPSWLTSGVTVVPLTRDEWMSVNPSNLIIIEGKLQNYTAPAVAIPLKTQAATAQSWIMQQANLAAAMGEVFTTDMRTYVKAITAIANGTDTTSTALPTQPTDVMEAATTETTGASTS